MCTCCGKVISYLNDKYHGGFGVANPFPSAFVQINTIKRILFRIVCFFHSRKKFPARGILRDLRKTREKAENGGCEQRRKKAVNPNS